MKRIVVLGAKGMLGSYLTDLLGQQGYRVTGFDLPDLDITDKPSVEGIIRDEQPDTVINCAAYTNVDACESNIDTAMAVNGYAPGILADICKRNGSTLVHYSTDYVFDGTAKNPYSEESEPHPLSVYGTSKLEGERLVKKYGKDYYILRTSWLFGEHGKNFVESIIAAAKKNSELTVVNDQVGSPTYVRDLAAATVAVLKDGQPGIYHISNSGCCSWYEYAVEIISRAGCSAVVLPCSTEEYPRPAVRPKYSVMSKEKIAQIGIVMRHWKDALHEYLIHRGNVA